MEGRITDAQASLLKRLGAVIKYDMSKQEASDLIAEIKETKSRREGEGKTINLPKTEFGNEAPFKRNYDVKNTAPMWGRYATDLLIAMIEHTTDRAKFDVVEAAKISIQIVLSMRNQFKE